MTDINRIGEIEEEEQAAPLLQKSAISEPSLKKNRSVRTKVPEAEVHVYKQGKGPIDVIKAGLGGWDQDQLEVREILDKYGFKTIYAFNPGSGRGVPVRFNPRNGRSLLTYRDGAVIYVDGEPKVSITHRYLCLFDCFDALFWGIMYVLHRDRYKGCGDVIHESIHLNMKSHAQFWVRNNCILIPFMLFEDGVDRIIGFMVFEKLY